MKKSLALILALIMVLCMLPSVAFAERMSWTWTVTIIGDNYYKSDGTASNTRTYTINKHLDNSTDHEIGYTFQWDAGAGGNNYNGGWQLCLTVDGNIVLRSTAYIYEKDMSNASDSWTAPASSHTENTSHSFTLYLSNFQNRFQNITLSYNANGGINAPASETKQVEKGQSATFTVSNQKPTRENYTFKGWSTNENATAADYNGRESITISENTTLYAVWANHEHNDGDGDGYCDTDRECMHEKDTHGYCIVEGCTHPHNGDGACCPKKPDNKPNPPEPENTSQPFIELTGEEAVKVKCTNAEATHADKEKSYGLKPGSYTIGNVEVTAEGGYTCDITVRPEQYVADYVSDPGHALDPTDQTGKMIKLSWNETGKKWEVASVIPVVFTVKCDTTVPGSVSEVTKTRLTDVANVPLPSGVDINVEPVVTFTDNNTSATLLYEFKVTGTPGAEVVIKDDGAKFIDNSEPETTVTLPAVVGNERETSTTVYGYRIFSVNDIQNGYLVNTATANVPNGDPKKDKTDTEGVPALDNRTLDNTLTVKKLVSGNAANKKEKFPFKATFTFPVPGGPNHFQQQQILGPVLFKATSTFPVHGASANPDGVTYGEKVEITFELAHGETRKFSYKSDQELRTKIDEWMKESGSLSGDGDAVFAKLSYKVEETDTKGYTLATNGDAEGKAEGDKTVTFTNTKNKPNDDHGGHYHPTTTPVPVIVIPPKTGDMPFWYSIAQFLGLVK